MQNLNEILKAYLPESSEKILFNNYKHLINPFEVGAFVYASDGIACIKIHKSLISDNYAKNEDPLNAALLFNVLGNHGQILDEITLKNLFRECPTMPTYEKCAACDGTGTRHCDCCGNDYNCSMCYGTGNGKEIGTKIYDSTMIIMRGVAFSYKNLKRLFDTATAINAPIEWVSKSKEKQNLFKIDSIDVLIMPMMQPSETLK